jgi:hypothetical protein
LSRNSDSNEGNIISKFYKEIDILYGTEIKNNPNIEFRYIEPTKLQEIERFFFEFYVAKASSIELFYDLNHEIKYFDYSLMNKISEIMINNKSVAKEGIFTKINSYLYDAFMKSKFHNQVDKPKTLNNPFFFMLLPQEQVIAEYFRSQEGKGTKGYDRAGLDMTLNLSKVEEMKYTDGNILFIKDGSFDVTNKVSFLSKEEDYQQPSFIIPVKAKISSTINAGNYSQTIDYFVNEIGGEKRVNGAEDNGGTDRRASEHSSFIKNNSKFFAKNIKEHSKHSKDRSSSFNQRMVKKQSLSPLATPIPKEKMDYFFVPGSPKFNYEN